MSDDHYHYASERGRLVGRLNGNEISPGYLMQVQIERVDLHKKQADFRVINSKFSKSKTKKRQPSHQNFSVKKNKFRQSKKTKRKRI